LSYASISRCLTGPKTRQPQRGAQF